MPKYLPCKLSRADGSTRNGCVLVKDATNRVEGRLILCERGLHFYRHPLLAVFMSPIHDVEEYNTLWLGEPGDEQIHDGELKSVCREFTPRKIAPLPAITTEQRVEIAIRCSLTLPDLPEAWLVWAHKWLSGEERSREAAAWAAAAAVRAAVWAAVRAADAWAEAAAAEAAWAAAAAAEAGDSPASLLDIIISVAGWKEEGV